MHSSKDPSSRDQTHIQELLTLAIGLLPVVWTLGVVLWGVAERYRDDPAWLAWPPAWIQAIGTIVALIIAVRIPIRIAEQERQRAVEKEAIEARSIALELLPHFNELLEGLLAACAYDMIEVTYTRTDSNTVSRRVFIGSSGGKRLPRSDLEVFATETRLSRKLLKSTPKLSLLGPAASSAQQAVRLAHDVSAMYQLVLTRFPGEAGDTKDRFAEAREACFLACETVQTAIDAMHALFPDVRRATQRIHGTKPSSSS
jgi:hypothetical protein